MSNRYGRRQKRAARETIASLENDISTLKAKLRSAQFAAGDAEARAFNRFIRDSDIYKHCLDKVARELGYAVGIELKPYAEKLMEVQRRQAPIVFDYRKRPDVDASGRTEIIEGRIPAFHYRVAMHPGFR